MFCRFLDGYDNSPELIKGTVYWLEIRNFNKGSDDRYHGTFEVSLPLREADRIYKTWTAIYTSHEGFLEDWEVL